MLDHINSYSNKLSQALLLPAFKNVVPTLGRALLDARASRNAIYLCGNGGSAANATHLANDLLYGAAGSGGDGLRVEALTANSSVITCLANDVGYDQIFAEQIRVKGARDDLLIALSGSGDSENIVQALLSANAAKMQTFAILGYSGGRCKEIAQHPIHFAIDDMQISEDLQLIVGHMCMQWLKTKKT